MAKTAQIDPITNEKIDLILLLRRKENPDCNKPEVIEEAVNALVKTLPPAVQKMINKFSETEPQPK